MHLVDLFHISTERTFLFVYVAVNIVVYCFDVPSYLFNQFPIDGHLGCFQCFSITNKAVTNIFIHKLFCTYENIAVGLIFISEIAVTYNFNKYCHIILFRGYSNLDFHWKCKEPQILLITKLTVYEKK